MRFGMRRLAPGVLAALVALAVVLRIGVVLNRRIDPDESQHLHVAWLIAEGQVPYRDFWEHHLPFFHYAMAPLTAWLTERPEVYFAARLIMCLLAAAAVVLTWRLARRLSADAAVWAAIVLLFLPQFAETSTETRPDVPALVAHLASLLALVRWRADRRPGWLWAAGACQGAALALSIKAIFALAGVGAVVVGLPGRGESLVGRASSLARFLGGLAIVPLFLVGGLAAFTGTATLEGLYRDVVLDSLRFVDFEKTWPFLGSEIGVFLVAALGLLLVLRVRGLAILGHPVHGALLLASPHRRLGAVPSPDSRRLPACLAPAAPGGRHLRRADPRHPGGVGAAGPDPLAKRARPGDGRGGGGRARRRNGHLRHPEPERRGSSVHAPRAAPARVRGRPVIDGTALSVFRPAAYRHGALIRGVRGVGRPGGHPGGGDRRRHAGGACAGGPRRLSDPRHGRAGRGPAAASTTCGDPDGLLLAGAEIAAAAGGGRSVVNLLAAGPYLLAFSPGLEVTVDGTPARPGWLAVPPGRHEIVWLGSGRDDPAHRRHLPGAGGGPAGQRRVKGREAFPTPHPPRWR